MPGLSELAVGLSLKVSGSRSHLGRGLLCTLTSVPIPLDKMEGVAAKRRRVSFGGCLRPELFDENLPPNTPLKRGETPKQRRSLAAHTPTVLKKIIKVRFPAGLPLGSDDGVHPGSTLFPGASLVAQRKGSTCSAGDPDLIPGSGRSPREGTGNPLHHSCLGNPTDRGAWWVTVHDVAKSWTQLK